jgi:hypothetical protein
LGNPDQATSSAQSMFSRVRLAFPGNRNRESSRLNRELEFAVTPRAQYRFSHRLNRRRLILPNTLVARHRGESRQTRRNARARKNRRRNISRQLVSNNFVNASILSGCNYRELLEQIAGRCSTPIPIEHLSKRLNDSKLIRGRTVFGSPGNFFDQIAESP